jgi:hypothetical protein
MNAEAFYTITGQHWRDMFARARTETNSVAEQIRAAVAVGRAEGDALLAAFRQHQAQSDFGAGAASVSGVSVTHGDVITRAPAPLIFTDAGSAARETRSAAETRAEAGVGNTFSPEGSPGAAIDGVPSLEPTRENLLQLSTSGAQVSPGQVRASLAA